MSPRLLAGPHGCKDPYNYCEGGYCPIEIGDHYASRFTILHKLGYGGFASSRSDVFPAAW